MHLFVRVQPDSLQHHRLCAPAWARESGFVTAADDIHPDVSAHSNLLHVQVVDIEEATAHGVAHEILLRIHEDPYCEHDGKSHFQ